MDEMTAIIFYEILTVVISEMSASLPFPSANNYNFLNGQQLKTSDMLEVTISLDVSYVYVPKCQLFVLSEMYVIIT